MKRENEEAFDFYTATEDGEQLLAEMESADLDKALVVWGVFSNPNGRRVLGWLCDQFKTGSHMVAHEHRNIGVDPIALAMWQGERNVIQWIADQMKIAESVK